MNLTPRHIQQLKRLEGQRLDLFKALEIIGRFSAMEREETEKGFPEVRNILDGWVENIEVKMNEIEAHLEKSIFESWEGDRA